MAQLCYSGCLPGHPVFGISSHLSPVSQIWTVHFVEIVTYGWQTVEVVWRSCVAGAVSLVACLRCLLASVFSATDVA